MTIAQLTVGELSEMLDNHPEELGSWQVVDVREPWELERASIRHARFHSTAIPMATIPLRQGELERDKKLLIMCRTGGRSTQVANFLVQNGFEQVYNLQGGITAWSREIDPSIPTY
ncbi:rhodanese-like domain-containing protein [Thiomonas sp.]|jgi:rhodanese-related sulfurtransferase|uniref:rhodanese-like domain-containing protein n=1 Tax=Thiomonas sp. TaxID=2047785 RepID=UPI00260ADC58|nr:rhodanese-like domain-containing protein [Thiomonas sp.]